jgi:enoyl-CoA hydratase
MIFKNLLVEIEKPIAVVTVNRPDKLNALNLETVDELGAAFAMLDANDDVRAIIMTGAGEKAFVAGADITEFRGQLAHNMMAFAKKGHDATRIMESMGKPIIAAVNGYALGGGCEMAMACDMRFASEKAKFGQPEILLGLIPGMGGTQRLPRLVGQGIARELMYAGEQITAQRADEEVRSQAGIDAVACRQDGQDRHQRWLRPGARHRARTRDALLLTLLEPPGP